MAHGGQKFTFGLVRRLGGFFGLSQLCGSDADLFFQVVALVGQPRFAVFNLRQHGVEPQGQRVQFCNVAGRGAQPVIGLCRDVFHQLAQAAQGG